MWTATIGIQANSCLLEPVYRYPHSYSYECERTLRPLNFLISHPFSDLCTGSRLMNALNINSCHSPTKFLQPANLDYLHNLISVQSACRTRSSSAVTLARPSVSSSLQITNRSFRYASPHLWNQLPSSCRQPHFVHCPPGSPHAPITSSVLSSLYLSLPWPFIPDFLTRLFHNSFPR